MRIPYRTRRVESPPKFYRFKPAGVPSRLLSSLNLTVDEFEAIRLADYRGMEHKAASELMNISRPTFTRLIEKARQKVAQVLIDGLELIIEGGNIEFVNNIYKCQSCGNLNEMPIEKRPGKCPKCNNPKMDDYADWYLRDEK